MSLMSLDNGANNFATHLTKNGMLNSYQCGFRKGHSTSHVLIKAINDWAEALNCCSSCHCSLLDFAKSTYVSITGNLLKLISAFLTSCSQRDKYY